MNNEDIDFLMSIQSLEQPDFDNAYLERENKKLKEEIERLNNIIKRLEEDLREMYLTFGEFSEEYTEKKIRELKGESNEEN